MQCRNLKGTKPSWREVIVIMADPAAGRNPAAAKRLAEFIAECNTKLSKDLDCS